MPQPVIESRPQQRADKFGWIIDSNARKDVQCLSHQRREVVGPVCQGSVIDGPRGLGDHERLATHFYDQARGHGKHVVRRRDPEWAPFHPSEVQTRTRESHYRVDCQTRCGQTRIYDVGTIAPGQVDDCLIGSDHRRDLVKDGDQGIVRYSHDDEICRCNRLTHTDERNSRQKRFGPNPTQVRAAVRRDNLMPDPTQGRSDDRSGSTHADESDA